MTWAGLGFCKERQRSTGQYCRGDGIPQLPLPLYQPLLLSLAETGSPHSPARAGQEQVWHSSCPWISQRQWNQWAGDGGTGSAGDVPLSTEEKEGGAESQGR